MTEYLTNMTPSYYGLTAQCTNVTYVFNITNASLTTIKVYATLESPIDPLKDPMGKIIEATIEACPIGFKLNRIKSMWHFKSLINSISWKDSFHLLFWFQYRL